MLECLTTLRYRDVLVGACPTPSLLCSFCGDGGGGGAKKLEREKERESDVALFFSNLNYRFLKDSATTKLAPSADILEPQQNTKFWCVRSFLRVLIRILIVGHTRFYA